MSSKRAGYRVGVVALAALALGAIFMLASLSNEQWGRSALASVQRGQESRSPGAAGLHSALITPTPGCGQAWNIVPSPNGGSGFSGLTGIDARSATDVWAVGYYTTTTSDAYQTLIEHWNGTQWSTVPSPAEGRLFGVAAVSANDAWAVGFTGTFPGPYQTVIERWNGTQWSLVSSPNPGSSGGQLYSVDAASPTDIWAVGFFVDSNASQTLTMHWDGTAWSVVFSPNAAINTELEGVTVVSPTDVWAVGAYVNPLRRYIPVTEV